MDKLTPQQALAQFKTQLDVFADLIKRFCQSNQEHVAQIKSATTKAKMALMIGERDAISLVATIMEPHAEHIMREDDEFYEKHDVLSHHQEHLEDAEVRSDALDVQEKVREWWSSFDAMQRKEIKKRTKVLFVLSAIAASHQPSLNVIASFTRS